MAGTDFSHLTNDELINGIKALDLPNYIRSKGYGIDVRETLAQMSEMFMQLAYNQGMSPQQAQDWVFQLNNKIIKGQVTLNDLTQEVKEAMTGGSVAVVGVGAVDTVNMKDAVVTKSKLETKIQKDKFMELEQIAPQLTVDNWAVTAHELTAINGGLKVKSSSGNSFARTSAPLSSQLSSGDKLQIRVKVVNLSSDAIRNRVMLRSGESGTIYLQNLYDVGGIGNEVIYEFQYTATQNTSNLRLFVDTIYPNNLVGRETNIYEISAIKLPSMLKGASVEEISEMTAYSNDVFNASYVLNSISELKAKNNWDINQENTVSVLEKVKLPSGEIKLVSNDKYSFPERLTWGNEYLYSYYVALEDSKDISVLVSGDSTTAGNQLLDNYRRHSLISQMLTKSGFPSEKLETINLGHGENTTKNWLDTWLAQDMDLIQTKLDGNILPLYILGWGINDGGLNYNAGTSIQDRVNIFESSLNSGLRTFRSTYSADDVPIILATPVTTYDLTNKRNNDEWQNHIRSIVKKSARDYQCAFIDLGLYHYDRGYSTKWSANGDRVHPNRYATKDYMSLFKDLLVPYLFEK